MSTTASSSSAHDEENLILTFQVGERQFKTTKTTLTDESPYFQVLLSLPEYIAPQTENGLHFLDVDPELFAHILRYLRSHVLPVFYDAKRGHDEALYLALLEQAQHFQIERLEKWITEKEYLNAVKIRRTASLLEGEDWLGKGEEDSGADGEVEYYPLWKRKLVYLCPRGIYVHRGKPDACGRDCHKAQGDKPDRFEEECVFTTLKVRKEMLFDRQICLPEQ